VHSHKAVGRNHRLIDLGADQRRNARKAIRINTLGVHTPAAQLCLSETEPSQLCGQTTEAAFERKTEELADELQRKCQEEPPCHGCLYNETKKDQTKIAARWMNFRDSFATARRNH
jgi:hypothetical protein